MLLSNPKYGNAKIAELGPDLKERWKILGLNAAKLYDIPVPEELQLPADAPGEPAGQEPPAQQLAETGQQ